MNAEKNLKDFFADEPPGQKVNAVRWLQKKVMDAALPLKRDFETTEEWEEFRGEIRERLPRAIGVPRFPSLEESYVRGRIRVGERVTCERVDVYVDEDYSIPSLVYSPLDPPEARMPAVVWSAGWQQDKWHPSVQKLGVRLAEKGFIVLTFDHAPDGETTPPVERGTVGMSLIMSMTQVLGISPMALRAAETMRCGEYLRERIDVDEERVAVSGLCQGGMDTWIAGALDGRFAAVAPICSATTFAVHFAEMASYKANGDASPFPFDMLGVCDVEHLHGCVAPRPLLIRANLPDDWWPVSGLDEVESFTRRIYSLYGAEERLDVRAEVHEHDITGPFADALERFLITWLT